MIRHDNNNGNVVIGSNVYTDIAGTAAIFVVMTDHRSYLLIEM